MVRVRVIRCASRRLTSARESGTGPSRSDPAPPFFAVAAVTARNACAHIAKACAGTRHRSGAYLVLIQGHCVLGWLDGDTRDRRDDGNDRRDWKSTVAITAPPHRDRCDTGERHQPYLKETGPAIRRPRQPADVTPSSQPRPMSTLRCFRNDRSARTGRSGTASSLARCADRRRARTRKTMTVAWMLAERRFDESYARNGRTRALSCLRGLCGHRRRRRGGDERRAGQRGVQRRRPSSARPDRPLLRQPRDAATVRRHPCGSRELPSGGTACRTGRNPGPATARVPSGWRCAVLGCTARSRRDHRPATTRRPCRLHRPKPHTGTRNPGLQTA